MINSKRGELTSTYIITTILVIAGFVVVLYFILNALNLGGQTTDDVCAFSVLTRATTPQTVSAYVPLKCTTKKVCLSDRGECEDFKGEENVRETIRLSGELAKDKEDIEKTLANEMYECWNMMGEGKLDLFNGGIWMTLGQSSQGVTCLICSRVKIKSKNNNTLLRYNESDKDNLGKRVNVEKYMEKTQIEGKSETYLQYFAKDRSVNGYKGIPANLKGEADKMYEAIGKEPNYFNGEDISEYAIVFTQIKTQDYWDTFNNLMSAGISSVVTFSQVPIVGRGVTSGAGLTIIGVVGAGASINAVSNVYQGKVAAVNHCSEFPQSKDESKKKGCSSVQILPYQVGPINNMCQFMEGNP